MLFVILVIMGWYKRIIAHTLLRNCSSKIVVHRSTTQRSISRINVVSRPNLGISELSQPIFRNSYLLKENQLKSPPFIYGAKRFYHFKLPKGYEGWSPEQKIIFVIGAVLLAVLAVVVTFQFALVVFVVGCGVVITLCVIDFETVPYTNRTHSVVISRGFEQQLGEYMFENIKKQYQGKILPPLHPQSIMVQRISQNIIEALQKGLRKDQVSSNITCSPESIQSPHVKAFIDKIVEEEKSNVEDKRNEDDEGLLDDKLALEKGTKSHTAHLEGLKWEVIVVDEPVVNAVCYPGGKIVVFTGLLNQLKQDAQVAMVIGHEVSHAVARHIAEQLLKDKWLSLLKDILHQLFKLNISDKKIDYFLSHPFSQRNEMEADCIGLLLVASAGYDPPVAIQFYEEFATCGSETTHPSGRKRTQRLAEGKVMEEALSIYKAVQAGHGIDGFLL